MLISKFDSIDLNKIVKYEEDIGIKLPDQYRAFISKYNGGETPNTSFKFNDISLDIKGFYGFGNVKFSIDKMDMSKIKESYYLPIALDSFGNEIVIDLKVGSILFKDHENGTIKKINDNFKEFIDKCESQPIKKASVKSVEEREKDLIKRGRGNLITDELKNMWRAEINKYASIKLEEISF